MVNRLMEFFEEPRERPSGPEYWEVAARNAWFCVDEPTARDLLEKLDRRRPPRWLRFTDLFGSKARVRSADIVHVIESTVAQRAANRNFRQALQSEEQGGRRPWEDCD